MGYILKKKIAIGASVFISFVVFVLFFQNCSKKFQVTDLNELTSASTVPNHKDIDLTTFNSTYFDNELGLALMSDGYIVNPGSVVSSENGEIILVWKTLRPFDSCRIAQIDVSNEGGPQVFKNLTSGQTYSFVCKSGTETKKLEFTYLNRKNVSNLTRPSNFNSKDVDIFLISGQSNAVGQQIGGQSILPVRSFHAARFLDGQLQELNGLGAWKSFAQRYFNLTERRVIFIPTSVPGTGTNPASSFGRGHWAPDHAIFKKSVSDYKIARASLISQGYQVHFKGVLWVQGENDADAINSSLQTVEHYSSSLQKIINAYRTEISDEHRFFIYQTGTAVGANDSGYRSVRQVQSQLPEKLSSTHLVYEKAITFPNRNLMWDSYHYMPDAYAEMGDLSARSVVSFLKGNAVQIPIPKLYLYSGPNLTNLISNGQISSSQKIKVMTSDLSVINATSFNLKIYFGTDTVGVIKGPYASAVTGNLSDLGFTVGKYSFRVQACTQSNCSDFSEVLTTLEVIAESVKCASGYVLVGEICKLKICEPNSALSCSSSGAYKQCNQLGTDYNIMNGPCESADICTAEVVSGKTVFNLSESIQIKVNAGTAADSVGQVNRVFNGSGELIASNTHVVDWGAAKGTVDFSAKSLARDLTPLLIKSSIIKIEYDIMKRNKTVWQSCHKKITLSWARSESSSGACLIPQSYQTSCGASNVNVFNGGVCHVTQSPISEEIGLDFICRNGTWQVY